MRASQSFYLFLGLFIGLHIRSLKNLESLLYQNDRNLVRDGQEAKQNRTLVIAMGNLRCGERAWKTLYENVLDVNAADLAVFTQEPLEVYRNASILKRAKYVYMIPKYEDWADALDLIANGTGWRDRLFPLYSPSSILLGGANNVQGSGAIIFYFRWFVSERIKENGWTEQYDRFIVGRNDHFYLCTHNLSELDPSYIWLPGGEDWGGITDRHMVVNSSTVLQALNVVPPLLQNPARYKDYLKRSRLNTEIFVKLRWQEDSLLNSVRRFDRVMFICGVPEDTPGWMRLGHQVDAGVHVKYPGEYGGSRETCYGEPKLYCGCPACSRSAQQEVRNSLPHSCKERIEYLMTWYQNTEHDACVAATSEGACIPECDPNTCNASSS